MKYFQDVIKAHHIDKSKYDLESITRYCARHMDDPTPDIRRSAYLILLRLHHDTGRDLHDSLLMLKPVHADIFSNA